MDSSILSQLKIVDVKNGSSIIYYIDTNTKKIHGTRKHFINGVCTQEDTFHQGQLHGVQKKWTHKGELFSVDHYVNGEMHGASITYDLNGVVKSNYNYENGHRNGRAEIYRENGTLCSIIHYKNDVSHGLSTDFYRSGRKQLSVNLVDGKMHGELRFWNDDGILIKQYFYCNGELHGPFREWYEIGNKKLTTEYVHGKKHGPEYKWSISRITPGEYIRYTEFYSNDKNVTEEVKQIVSTIHRLTDQEKTSIALNYGFNIC